MSYNSVKTALMETSSVWSQWWNGLVEQTAASEMVN